jgi:L-lactate dehydrogenase
MKLGIIGVGAVGAATAMAVTLRARVRELVLIDRDRARARAVATDMHYGVPLSPLVTIRDGNYDDLEGAGPVIIAAGVNEKAGGALPTGAIRLAGFVFSTPMWRYSSPSHRSWLRRA